MKTIESEFSNSFGLKSSSAEDRTTICERLLASRPGLEPLFLRLGLAIVLFPHGAQKLLGWFGGYGFSGSMEFLTQAMGIPGTIAVMVIGIEFFAPLLLVMGLATRLASLSLGGIMLGAMLMVQMQHGFFMNWSGNQAGEGIQFTLLFLASAAALVVRGAGSYSVDNLLSRQHAISESKPSGMNSDE